MAEPTRGTSDYRDDDEQRKLKYGEQRRLDRPTEEKCFVAFLWFLILGEAASVVGCEFLPWGWISRGGVSVRGALVMLAYCGLTWLIARSFSISSTLTSYVPFDWRPSGVPEEELAKAREEAQRAAKDKRPYSAITREQRRERSLQHYSSIRWCVHCRCFKPARSHHCKECHRCVMRLDHHCPWIGSCVGQRNHKAFVLFLLYGLLGVGSTVALHIIGIVLAVTDAKREVSAARMVVMVCSLALCSPFVIGLIPLLVSQLITLVKNETTLEELINHRVRSVDRSWRSPANRGCCRNFREFMGPSGRHCLWPEPMPFDFSSLLRVDASRSEEIV